MTRISGSKKAATAKPKRTVIPLEYLFTGVSIYLSMPAKSIISSILCLISQRVIPIMAPFIYIFSLPVISGWNPVPTSNKEAILPFARITPVVGAVIRDKSFNKVDFPEPFLPIIPTTSPCLTSNDMFFNAHTNSECPLLERSFVSPTLR